MPVISMELLPGGTLKDRVAAQRPDAAAEAVAAVLESIGGLDAAAGRRHPASRHQAVELLRRSRRHRQGRRLRPVDLDARARRASAARRRPGFEGTPQFAPPEQLRGEPLDVRADIYAVGATLYYLLTGRPPFDAPDLRELFATGDERAPASPRQLRRRHSGAALGGGDAVSGEDTRRPAGVVSRARGRAAAVSRPQRQAGAVRHAHAGRRAGRWIIVGFPVALLTELVGSALRVARNGPAALTNCRGWRPSSTTWLEGATGASFGKRLFGLRVVSADGTGPSWGQIASEHVCFTCRTSRCSDALVPGSSTATEDGRRGFYIDGSRRDRPSWRS